MSRLIQGALTSAVLCFFFCTVTDPKPLEQNIVYSVVAAAIFAFLYSLGGSTYPKPGDKP